MNEIAPQPAPSSEDPAEELRSRFPDLQPVTGVPSLFTINGVGTSLYGRRDTDRETGTYVKTLCVVVLFVPVFCLKAFRVLDAPGGGWFFVGRTKLSGFARTFNLLALSAAVLVAAGIGWGAHTSTPAYKAQQQAARAQELETEGKPVAAVRAWIKLAGGPRQAEGREALQRLLSGPLTTLPLPESQTALQAIHGSPYQGQVLKGAQLEAWLTHVKAGLEADPQGALAHLELLQPLAPKQVPPLEEQALRALVAKEPKDGRRASRLALLLEASDRLKEAIPILKAAGVEALKETEGARIYGQYLAARGEIEGAHALLLPYVETRLAKVHQLERSMGQTIAAAEQAALGELRANRAGPDWYRRHKLATKTKQREMVSKWIFDRMKANPRLIKLREELTEANRVVPVALDLGIVKIQRARSLKDPAARKAELEAAESILLKLQRSAGASIAYQINLGKVRYQLGKSKEGRQTFDDLLAKQKRAPQALLLVAQACREVGANADARALSEEAWKTAKEPERKQAAASFRSLLSRDADDRMTWLGRADQQDPSIAADLATTRARKALRAGQEGKAVEYLRAAVAHYKKLPVSAATLNNVSLVHRQLYELTGDPTQLELYARKLARAESLQPGDPILMQNAASALAGQAVQQTVGDAFHLRVLRMQPSIWLQSFLIDDAAGRKAVAARLAKQEAFVGAVKRYQKLLVLAPRLPGPKQVLLELLAVERDPKAHRALVSAVAAAELDYSDQQAAAATRFAPPTADDRRAYEKTVERHAETLSRAQKHGHAPTHALAICTWIQAKLSGCRFARETIDPAELVARAQEAVRLAPSLGTRSMVHEARMLRTARRLWETQPGFKAMRERSRQALSASTLVAVALLDDELGPVVAKDPDVVAAVEQIAARLARDPKSVGTIEWALLRRTKPEEAAAVAARLKDDPVATMRRELRRVLDPFDVEAVCVAVIAAHMRGEPKAAAELIASAAKRQLPLPWKP